MKKRIIGTIKQFDYTSKEDFLTDISKMKEKGYSLISDGMFGGCLEPQEIDNNDTWKYTACFVKSDFM